VYNRSTLKTCGDGWYLSYLRERVDSRPFDFAQGRLSAGMTKGAVMTNDAASSCVKSVSIVSQILRCAQDDKGCGNDRRGGLSTGGVGDKAGVTR
jgi:hypothetical protein